MKSAVRKVAGAGVPMTPSSAHVARATLYTHPLCLGSRRSSGRAGIEKVVKGALEDLGWVLSR